MTVWACAARDSHDEAAQVARVALFTRRSRARGNDTSRSPAAGLSHGRRCHCRVGVLWVSIGDATAQDRRRECQSRELLAEARRVDFLPSPGDTCIRGNAVARDGRRILGILEPSEAPDDGDTFGVITMVHAAASTPEVTLTCRARCASTRSFCCVRRVTR